MATPAEEIWAILREVVQSQKETDRKIREEAEESRHGFRKMSQETGCRIQETDQIVKKLSKRLGDLGNHLGEFVVHMVCFNGVRAISSTRNSSA